MDKYIIPNLRNACQAMTLLSQSSAGYTVAEITQKLRVPRTTVLRILTTLCAEDMATKRANKYFGGGGLVRLGFQSLSNVEIRAIAAPTMRRLSEQTRETSHMGVLFGKRLLLVEVCDGPNPVRVSSRVGTMAALHCSATGKVLLAYGIEEPLKTFYGKQSLEKRTPKTITAMKALMKETEKVRSQGYALDDEEYFAGVRCLAAPIFDVTGEVTAAVGITAPATNFPKQRVKKMARLVMDAAQQISRSIGG